MTQTDWLDRLIPLPQQVTVERAARVPAEKIGIVCEAPLAPPVRTALELLARFAQGAGERAVFVIRLTLSGENARLATVPNAEQAYAITPTDNGRGLTLAANMPAGLLYAARTLAQLVASPVVIRADTEIELPLARILDWPAIAERGQWGGNAPQDLAWTSQWKLNTLEVDAGAAVDAHGAPVIRMNRDLFRQGATLGVKIVPYIMHLEQLAKYGGLMDRPEYTSTPDPNAPLPSDYIPGLCMSSPATQELITAWLMRAAEIEGVRDIQVWLSEDAAPCYCPRCVGQEPYGLEVACLVRALRRVQETHPHVRLRILTTQGSYPVNDRVLAAVPEDVGVSYYEGRRTYDSSYNPMIYPLMEEYARSGRWLGVYPQITQVFRTVFPWTAPQFIRYRAQEFADKGLANVIGYAVPSNRCHEFNVMALAEWTWHPHGRMPEEFARAYATVTGIADPDRFARWALLAGAAGWALADSRFDVNIIYDCALWDRPETTFAERYRDARISDAAFYDSAIAQANDALALAREIGHADLIAESECTLCSLQAFGLLRDVVPLLKGASLDASQRAEVVAALDELERCAYVLRTRLIEWGTRVLPGDKLPSRLLDTAASLLRVCDGAYRLAARHGIADPRPAYRLRPLATWSERDFVASPRARLLINLEELVPPEGGSYHVGFDFTASAWGADVAHVAVVTPSGERAGENLLAETPDRVTHIGRWDRWYEMRLAIPPRPPTGPRLLAVTLTGTPTGAPPERRSCDGVISLRRVWERADAPWRD